uniref:opioid-binding protein/cell adhesion molecule homolog n=1 Tax=Monopterus albus TaxID=43700 RepID=UPI0009B46EEA|nr:opioid-binding protein/cell adhesion molecule homolog [Monopterus albus]
MAVHRLVWWRLAGLSSSRFGGEVRGGGRCSRDGNKAMEAIGKQGWQELEKNGVSDDEAALLPPVPEWVGDDEAALLPALVGFAGEAALLPALVGFAGEAALLPAPAPQPAPRRQHPLPAPQPAPHLSFQPDLQLQLQSPSQPSSDRCRVPPKIINLSRDIVVNEGSNVTLMCQASGKPEPSISWKLISSSGDLASDDEYLEIPSITRQRAGTYECTADNNIDADAQTVDITVNYAPTVSEGRDIGVTLGQRGVLECEADAVPEADFEWYKDDRRIFNGFDGVEIVNTGSLSKLTFFNVSEGDYGNYTCVAINKLGSSNTSFLLYVVIEPTSSTLLQGPRAVQDGSSGAVGMRSHTCLLFIAFLPLLLRF